MNLEVVREHCLSLPGSEETLPFGPEVIVYKVAGRMFALLIPEDEPPRMNLKCEPERALELRDRHEAVRPGWHMNKRHWNTVQLDGSLPAGLLRELIEHSHALVVAGLSATARRALAGG